MQKTAVVMQNSDEIDFLVSYESREEEGFYFKATFDELCKEAANSMPYISVDDKHIIFTMVKLGWNIQIIEHDAVYSGWVH